MAPSGHDDRGTKLAPRHASPPNYFSRSVQVKILVMVFLFMGVLMLMSEARKEKNWQWMWNLSGESSQHDAPDQERGTADSNAPINTRPPRVADSGERTGEPVVTAADRPSLVVDQDTAEQKPSTAQRDGWNFVLRRFSADQRELLQLGMWSWHHEQSLSDADRDQWSELVQRLDEQWADYHTRAYLSVAQDDDQLTDSQKRTCIEIIEASKVQWAANKAALEAVGQGVPVGKEHKETLTNLQRILDQRAWAHVQDNSVLQAAETEAWYRCWDQLQSLTLQQYAQATGPLNFVQLFSQPNEYRGRLIRVRGTARSGYRKDARDPRFGVTGYIVLGLRPDDDSASPIAIYCTELPEGFPEIKEADELGRGTAIDEDVEITGFFFKRWLHRSEGGMNFAPLILGKVTQWQPSAATQQRGPRVPLAGWMIWGSVLVMALLATGIALWVYRSSSWNTSRAAASTKAPDTLPPFEAESVGDNVAESLRRIETGENHR